jgi:hypothetical protein
MLILRAIQHIAAYGYASRYTVRIVGPIYVFEIVGYLVRGICILRHFFLTGVRKPERA